MNHELRGLGISQPRLDRPDAMRAGRLRRRLRGLVVPPARVFASRGRDLPEVTIRPAVVSDGAQLTRLAEVSERRLPSGLVLVAEVDDIIVAAMPVDGGPVLADVLRPTLDVVQLLELRADQLRASGLRRAA
jgi:hypothetical protein